MSALSILDIGPLTEEISVGGGNTITVRPVTPEGFFVLISMFPQLKSLMDNSGSLDAATLVKVVPASIAMVIAICTTDRESYDTYDAWTRQLAAVAAVVNKRLVPPVQLSIINAAIRMTFPDGVGPFVKELGALTSSISDVTSAASGPVSATTSLKRSRSGFSTDSDGMRLGRGAASASSTH